MIKRNGVYYLIYSGSGASKRLYSVGYATSNNPRGPFVKYKGNPIVGPTDKVSGPGHGCVVELKSGEYWHVYHQKKDTNVSWDRDICIDCLWFDDSGVLRNLAKESPGTLVEG